MHSVARRKALSLVDVLVTIAIVGVLIAIALPVIQLARESARRGQCATRLRQLGIAVQSYHADHKVLPMGGLGGFSLHVSILPYIEASGVFNAANISHSVWARENRTVASIRIQLFACPTDGSSQSVSPSTNYVGNAGTGYELAGYNGVFAPATFKGALRLADLVDGLSNVVAMSECLVGDGNNEPRRVVWNTSLRRPFAEFRAECASFIPPPGAAPDTWMRGRPWIAGDNGHTLYNHIFTPNGPSCFNGTRVPEGAYSATSQHNGGVNVLCADGRVVFVSESVNEDVWTAIASRAGGESVEF